MRFAPAPSDELYGVVRTIDEVSVVCTEDSAPPDARQESGWRALSVQGPLAFDEIGVLAALSVPLAQAGISLFVVSTFDTDYILVRQRKLQPALAALRAAGHEIESLTD